MKSIFGFIFLVFVFTGYVYGANIVSRGKDILKKADFRLYPAEGSYIIKIKAEDIEGNLVEFHIEGYKKGHHNQTIVWTFPQINRNDVGIRSGGTIYYKPSRWHKADIMSYQAAFVHTGFSWGDILSTEIAEDYKTVELRNTNVNGVDAVYLRLEPARSGLYARIDILVDMGNYNTIERNYYTASGDILKTVVFRNIKEERGKVTGFEIFMDNKFYELSGTAAVTDIEAKRLPSFIFNPENIGRIRATE